MQETASYYERHIFFCLNERKNGEECCANHQAQAAFDRCKSQVKAAGLSEKELKMADQLVEDMTAPWKPAEFKDTFRERILELVDQKLAAGQSKVVKHLEDEVAQSAPSNVIDLTELLQRSLKRSKDSARAQVPAKPAAAAARPARKSAARAPAKKTAHARAVAKRRAA